MLPFALKTVGTKFPSFSQKGTKGKGIPPSQPRHHPGTTQAPPRMRKNLEKSPGWQYTNLPENNHQM